MGFEDQVTQWFLSSAYEPVWVYSLIVVIMFASSFGLPLPEEVILIGAGLAGYVSLHPDIYPPPYAGAHGVNPITLAIVCLLAVFLSDYLIYWIGAYFGDWLMNHPRWKQYFQNRSFQRVQKWIHDYGLLAPFIFRFTPGLRFPGHMMCGAIGLSRWKFIAIDGSAALLTVPTQILLISYYGEVILDIINRGKYVLVGTVVSAFFVFILMRRRKKHQFAQESGQQIDSLHPSSPSTPDVRLYSQGEREKAEPAIKPPPSPDAID